MINSLAPILRLTTQEPLCRPKEIRGGIPKITIHAFFLGVTAKYLDQSCQKRVRRRFGGVNFLHADVGDVDIVGPRKQREPGERRKRRRRLRLGHPDKPARTAEADRPRSEEHTSELQSLMRIS